MAPRTCVERWIHLQGRMRPLHRSPRTYVAREVRLDPAKLSCMLPRRPRVPTVLLLAGREPGALVLGLATAGEPDPIGPLVLGGTAAAAAAAGGGGVSGGGGRGVCRTIMPVRDCRGWRTCPWPLGDVGLELAVALVAAVARELLKAIP